MYKPDKATTERHAKILRELVKQPDNKVCADCKRNDPRWASWNLGVFLCIRCSGIHRGMGTHISRVKSIDLDAWTPEQMESIRKWGNHRANLYWEAHLKAGHLPPDHKMESFIRSKYESRRWAMEGPPPSDPSVLENPARSSSNGEAAPSAAAAAPLFDASPAPAPAPSASAHKPRAHVPSRSLSLPNPASPVVTNEPRSQPYQSQPRELLSKAVAGRVNAQNAVAPQPQPQKQKQQQQQQPPQQPLKPSADADFFALDFHAPTSAPAPAPAPAPAAKDVKQDILSLFSAAPSGPVSTQLQPANAFGQFASVPQSSWDAFGAHPQLPSAQTQTQSPPISMMGNNGTGMWGVSSGWNGAIPNATPSSNIWGAPASAITSTGTSTAVSGSGANGLGAFNTTDIWGGGGGSSTTASTTNSLVASQLGGAAAPKKDDVFGDLWGDFK